MAPPVLGRCRGNYIIRGTPYNDGHVLARLYDADAATAGQERGFHAIALDARAPKFDGGSPPAWTPSPSASSSTSSASVLRRGRGHLAEALRDLGAAHR